MNSSAHRRRIAVIATSACGQVPYCGRAKRLERNKDAIKKRLERNKKGALLRALSEMMFDRALAL
jgi:hypothetical protein